MTQEHATRRAPAPCRLKTILVVEDTEDLRAMVAELLRGEGYVVYEAENGQRALDILGTLDGEPCLVLLDMLMPVMDGLTFLRTLREAHRVAPLPVVIVSGTPAPSGVDGVRFVKKPLSSDLLLELAREFCGPA